ncbi:hypothetical protein DAPPUDRAFT_257276 [Daphnia pulex]|uniref:Uncharacterized protein n=1 Tax=Daphnia pulex TaxID=6669 RepID=E9HD84_DAPPU|nr:hypothetical protein DAPPUDRAFT_257276 [Daphnia pulex]|eukprot:EFX70328.1 hypothetical protein DAPPUDRAFT_257276 [Daphnia pulex]
MSPILLYTSPFCVFSSFSWLLSSLWPLPSAYPQGLDSAYKPAASYTAPAYKDAGYSNGRAKIQVYRGPSKGYEGGKGRLLEVNVRSARPFALI